MACRISLKKTHSKPISQFKHAHSLRISYTIDLKLYRKVDMTVEEILYFKFND